MSTQLVALLLLSAPAPFEAVDRVVLAAQPADVERALLDVRRWPTLFADVAAVAGVRVDAQGVVHAVLTSRATHDRHAVAVRRVAGGVALRIESSFGVVVHETFMLDGIDGIDSGDGGDGSDGSDGSDGDHGTAPPLDAGALTLVVVRARTEIAPLLQSMLAREDVIAELRTMMRADIADLVRRFGAAHVARGDAARALRGDAR